MRTDPQREMKRNKEVDIRKLEADLRRDPQMGSRTYQSSIVKMMKKKRRWI